MRTKILLFVSLFMCIALNVNSSKQEVETTLREIIIKTKPQNIARLTAPKLGSTQGVAPTAFIMDNTITVNFSSSVSNATVLVTNAQTGEVVYYELFSSAAAATLYIQLDGCGEGLYFLDIASKAGEYSGEFMLD